MNPLSTCGVFGSGPPTTLRLIAPIVPQPARLADTQRETAIRNRTLFVLNNTG
jgi:hypothetical protein